jgi:transcriptional regulator with XRE-family HTH domain
VSRSPFSGLEDQIEQNTRERLHRRRKDLGLSRAEVARKVAELGHGSAGGLTNQPTISRQMVEKIENGRRRLRAGELELFLAALEFNEEEEREFRHGLGRPYKSVTIEGATARAAADGRPGSA